MSVQSGRVRRIEKIADGRGESTGPGDDARDLGTESLQPATLACAIVFSGFAVYHALTVAPGPRGLAVAWDLAVFVLCSVVYLICRRSRLTPRAFHLITSALSIAIAGDSLLCGVLGANPLFSHFDSLIVIGTVVVIPSPRWASAATAIQLAGWAVVAWLVLPRAELAPDVLVMVSSVAVGFIIHAGRRRARNRIRELRAGDARREQALQRALAEADEARRGLDRKVEERTAALRTELEERERLEAQLRHAQKLEAVGRLAGGVAHDFNNLLTVIRMSHTTLTEPDASTDELADAMRDASDATDRAAALTHDLLAFARKQTLQRANVAVADILGGVERMVRRVAEASIRLEVSTTPDAGDVLADRHQIEQVLLNLAINACDAMGNRGTLTIAATVLDLEAADAANHRVRPGVYVRIAVTDTGTGMDEATRRLVFEPFFTTKEVGRGTGLGLAVAHGIVTQHGGQIEVESELGIGSTFTVLLPRSRGVSQRHAVAATRPATSLAGETVLLVEDEAAVRRAVRRTLERLGYRVHAASDGEDAVRIAETLDGIDLLLTDVVMPGIDGPELACRLRDRWRDLPVLFVTGYSADRLARTGAIGPHDKILEKPYQPAELARTIRHMLESHTARRDAAS
jgi:signal transduction histidine kinase/ActR/RegA family two-component response regulator